MQMRIFCQFEKATGLLPLEILDMPSIDLLEELQLNDYYPQKLSFSDAIKLRGTSQNGCQEQYGLEIVRKLLMFDSTAVVSVASEIDKRLNSIGVKETETEDQRVSDGVRPPWRSNVRPSRRSGNAERNDPIYHPMDLLVVVMNCCDDFLRQLLVEKMFANKLSIPILLPDVRKGSYTLLLFALRSLVPEVHRLRDGSESLTDTLVDAKNPVVSFIRAGNLHRSKSKLVNELLGFNSFNTFFHRECPKGSFKRSVSNGSIEAAWFQSETATEEEFNCKLFTALNLRGDARDYPKQTRYLCQSSTLTVLMVDSFESLKDLCENVLKYVDASQTKIVVNYISTESPDKVDETYFEYLDYLSSHGVISSVKYDWLHGTQKMSDNEFANDLRKTISELFRPKHGDSHQMPTYTNIIQSGKSFWFSLDEDKLEYNREKSDKFIRLVLEQVQDCKPMLLPLQGDPWKKIGKLEREQRRKSQGDDQDAYFIAEKETEKRRQRAIQCLSLIQQNKITLKFSLKFHSLTEHNLLYYLNSCKIKLDARRRDIILKNGNEEYEKKKQGHHPQISKEVDREVKLSQIKLQTAKSVIGLEHFLRECGQMYEAVISEEIRMKEELKDARLTPDNICNFPSIVAGLLMKGLPLELMDGDASNVPITWVKAVLNQVSIMTSNAKVFVLSIIGVQSSGKSTLLNALFGLQFPVSAGQCTRGIYCHLVPVDKKSLFAKYDYILVVDTEGLRDTEFMGKSTFADNELATFAIGLADATIINMKGENWSEMKDILQIVAHGLIRVRKTKAELELMPRCMFVHQNVSAADAEEKNRLGQENQLLLLDKAIKEAGRAEGVTEITKFDDVIKYDPGSHSWYFPDLWNGKQPRARISQDYTVKVNELRKHLMQVMNDNPSRLTILSFVLRMSDLWNAMLHNDFVLSFRNTQEIIAGTILNDRISHEVDRFKTQNKVEQTNIRESICSSTSIEKFRAENESILRHASAAVEKNFTNMKSMLQDVINGSDICAALKKKYEISLTEIKDGEIQRINDETIKDISVHMKKLEYENDRKVKELKARLAVLEQCDEKVEKDKLNETEMTECESRWQQLIADNEMLVDKRMKIVESEIEVTIRGSFQKLNVKDVGLVQIDFADWAEIFKTPLVAKMPQVTEIDILKNHKERGPTRWVMDFVYSKSYVYKANSHLYQANKKWNLQFQNQIDLEFDASHLGQVMFEVSQLLGISWKEQSEGCLVPDEICSILPSGYSFTPDYIIRFIKFICHYTYNRSLENSKRFIFLTDPLADINERYIRSVSHYRQMSSEANIDAVSEIIFDYAKRSFVRDLGELIKTQVCKDENKDPTFKSKRAFLRTILTDLAQQTKIISDVNDETQRIFEKFMLYAEMAESEASEDFFLDVILKLLKEMLTKGNTPETDFQKIVKYNVGMVVEKAKNALRQSETKCKGRVREYVRIFKDCMNVSNEIDFGINIFNGFTEGVVEKIDDLYAFFLSQANSSFVTLVCEKNKAGIRPLFEKIMGCRAKCPFCSAPCSQSLDQHAGYHRANHHYPMGVRGTVNCWGLFANTQETHDAVGEKKRKPRKLTLSTCQAMVGTRVDVRTTVTVKKARKWHQSDYHSFKKYKEIDEYKDWDIPYSRDHNASLYWKWFMAQFGQELAVRYKALCPVIPEAWKEITWEEAKENLYEHDINYF